MGNKHKKSKNQMLNINYSSGMKPFVMYILLNRKSLFILTLTDSRNINLFLAYT